MIVGRSVQPNAARALTKRVLGGQGQQDAAKPLAPEGGQQTNPLDLDVTAGLAEFKEARHILTAPRDLKVDVDAAEIGDPSTVGPIRSLQPKPPTHFAP